MPLLPSTRSTLRDSLMRHPQYLERLEQITEILSGWITKAQAAGEIASDLPQDVLLLTLFARSCDPVLDYLKLGGQYSDDEIVEHLLDVTFDGLAARSRALRKSGSRRAA
jgi:hypothetical protein